MPATAAGILCGAGAALFWAAGFVAARHGIAIGFSPADIALHRFVWAGLVFLPLLARDGLGDLGGVGWGKGVALTLFGGPPLALFSYAGFLFVPLAHGGVIQPSCAALGGLLLLVDPTNSVLVCAAMMLTSAAIVSFLESAEVANRPITDPVANITAGVNYMVENYGINTLAAGGRSNAAGSYIGY